MKRSDILNTTQKENIQLRSKIIYAIETYFHTMNYVAVHTPTCSDWLIPERHIPVYAIERSPQKYLLPSPELHLKQLLAMWDEPNPPNIYEISHSFRNEHIDDSIHNDEFLMLEWYTMNATLTDAITTCIDILKAAVEPLNRAQHEKLPLWVTHIDAPLIQRMADVFHEHAHLSLETLIACETAEQAAEYATPVSESTHAHLHNYEWDDIFHILLANRIEPHLPKNRPVFLTHYPARIPTLAASCTHNPIWAERWELYLHGIEIANGYVEETDPHIIAAFMHDEQKKIAAGHHARSQHIPHNTNFLTRRTLPPCAGVAMGIDRLMLALLYDESTATRLQDVSPLAIFQ